MPVLLKKEQIQRKQTGGNMAALPFNLQDSHLQSVCLKFA